MHDRFGISWRFAKTRCCARIVTCMVILQSNALANLLESYSNLIMNILPILYFSPKDRTKRNVGTSRDCHRVLLLFTGTPLLNSTSTLTTYLAPISNRLLLFHKHELYNILLPDLLAPNGSLPLPLLINESRSK